jgi:hypothetical protein
MQINPEILVYLPTKQSLIGGGLRCYFFLKSTSNARKLESNMQFQSKQLDRESKDPEKDSCTIIDDDFDVCSSADN